MNENYYYLLGLKEGASIEEIKAAYRKLSPKFHPDHNNGDKFFEERFKEINEAYEALIKDLSMVICPRCFGKGHVDLNDIKRLGREGLWVPGKCLYCDGAGKVKKELPGEIDPADFFFGMNLSEEEKQKIINFLILNHQKSASQKNGKKTTPQMENNSRKHISKKIIFSLAFIFLVVGGIVIVLFIKKFGPQDKNNPTGSFKRPPLSDFERFESSVDTFTTSGTTDTTRLSPDTAVTKSTLVAKSPNLNDIVTVESADSTSAKKLNLRDFVFQNEDDRNIENLDQNGNHFKTIEINGMVWIQENLNVSYFKNGDPIPEATTKKDWTRASNNKTPAWCYYNNDPDLGQIYGKLYNWYAVNDPRGLAPPGWHIPSNSEWTNLINYLGGEGGGDKMKMAYGWHLKGNGDDQSGFKALPGGMRYPGGPNFEDIDFMYKGGIGCWWSSTEKNGDAAWFIQLSSENNLISYDSWNEATGCSVRCIRDKNIN